MIRAAVIGAGWWGRIIARTLAGSSVIRVAAVFDPDRAAARNLCEEQGLTLLASFEAAVHAPAIDAVILTSPHRHHEAQVVQAAAAGKHVFCEKPLTLCAAAAERAIRACVEHGVRLGIGHERRFEPPMQAVRQAIASGELGELMHIEANFSQNKFLALAPDNWRLQRAEAGCGPMTATGIHFLDAAIGLAGPARRVYASNANRVSGFDSGDNAAAHLAFDNGVSATISAMLATPFYSRFSVFGSRGWMEVRDKSHVESPSGWTLLRSAPGEAATATEYPVATPVRENLEAFARAIAQGQEAYPIPLSDMLHTVRALDAVYRSAHDGRIVELPHDGPQEDAPWAS